MTFHARRAQVETALAVVCAALLVLTVLWSEWIEALLHVDPDGGSGATEWAVVAALAVATLASAAAARADRRRPASERA